VKGIPLVDNTRTASIISQAFNNKYGGVRVIATPLGSGITSFLTSSVNTFIESGGKARLLGSELRGQDDFHAAFGGEDIRLMLLFPPFDVVDSNRSVRSFQRAAERDREFDSSSGV
jgi:hypothetical protein